MSKYSNAAASKLDGIRKQMHATVLHTPKCLQQTHAPVRKLAAVNQVISLTHYNVSAIGEAHARAHTHKNAYDRHLLNIHLFKISHSHSEH